MNNLSTISLRPLAVDTSSGNLNTKLPRLLTSPRTSRIASDRNKSLARPAKSDAISDLKQQLQSHVKTFTHVSSSFLTRCLLLQLQYDGVELIHTNELAAVFRSIRTILICVRLSSKDEAEPKDAPSRSGVKSTKKGSNMTLMANMKELRSRSLELVRYWKRTMIPSAQRLGSAREGKEEMRRLMDMFIVRFEDFIGFLDAQISEFLTSLDVPFAPSVGAQREKALDDRANLSSSSMPLLTAAPEIAATEEATIFRRRPSEAVKQRPFSSAENLTSLGVRTVGTSQNKSSVWNIEDMHSDLKKLKETYERVMSRQKEEQDRVFNEIKRDSKASTSDSFLRNSLLRHSPEAGKMRPRGLSGGTTRSGESETGIRSRAGSAKSGNSLRAEAAAVSNKPRGISSGTAKSGESWFNAPPPPLQSPDTNITSPSVTNPKPNSLERLSPESTTVRLKEDEPEISDTSRAALKRYRSLIMPSARTKSTVETSLEESLETTLKDAELLPASQIPAAVSKYEYYEENDGRGKFVLTKSHSSNGLDAFQTGKKKGVLRAKLTNVKTSLKSLFNTSQKRQE